MARSSMSAGTASNARPALPSSICRARLCDARISGSLPRQIVMPKDSFGMPRLLPVGIKLHDGGRGFLDRAPGHIELRPVEFRAQPPRIGDFVGHRLAVDIVLIRRPGAH